MMHVAISKATLPASREPDQNWRTLPKGKMVFPTNPPLWRKNKAQFPDVLKADPFG